MQRSSRPWCAAPKSSCRDRARAGLNRPTSNSHNKYYGNLRDIAEHSQYVTMKRRGLLLRPLVLLRDEPVEQPHAPARAPARIDLGLRRVHRRAGKIDMRPGSVLDEELDEGCRRARAGPAPADILDVGVLGLDHLVVGLVERHAPDLLPCRGACIEQFCREAVIIHEEPG